MGESGRAEYYLQNLRTSKNKKKLLVSDDPSLVKQLIYVKYKHVLQPRSPGSLLPALTLAGRREPWEQGWMLLRVAHQSQMREICEIKKST